MNCGMDGENVLGFNIFLLLDFRQLLVNPLYKKHGQPMPDFGDRIKPHARRYCNRQLRQKKGIWARGRSVDQRVSGTASLILSDAEGRQLRGPLPATLEGQRVVP